MSTALQYIACFETLVQLALAMTARHALGSTTWQFALPRASDNTTAEARSEKLWCTAEPLAGFLKLVAGWAARHHIELLVTHLAGEQNTCADELSRGNLSRFRNRTAQRYRLALQVFLDPTGLHHAASTRRRMARPASSRTASSLKGKEQRISGRAPLLQCKLLVPAQGTSSRCREGTRTDWTCTKLKRGHVCTHCISFSLGIALPTDTFVHPPVQKRESACSAVFVGCRKARE